MNERIKELAEQAGLTLSVDQQVAFQRAAELLVRECANVIYDADYQGPAFSNLILNHFGVKE